MDLIYASDIEKRREKLKYLRMMAAREGKAPPESLPVGYDLNPRHKDADAK